jgi:hypothetical protein
MAIVPQVKRRRVAAISAGRGAHNAQAETRDMRGRQMPPTVIFKYTTPVKIWACSFHWKGEPALQVPEPPGNVLPVKIDCKRFFTLFLIPIYLIPRHSLPNPPASLHSSSAKPFPIWFKISIQEKSGPAFGIAIPSRPGVGWKLAGAKNRF